ncbi:DNA adenine methylase [Gemmatimonadota bacterium]
MSSLPQPIPYQGSKRKLASRILLFMPSRVETLYEPFAGSAAITLAAASRGTAARFHVNDILAPLAGIWRLIVNNPADLIESYRRLWEQQTGIEQSFYNQIRHEFNADQDPAKLMFLLARCVKGAIRFNNRGEFNQSPDNRRRGAKPDTVAERVMFAHNLLSGRTEVSTRDYSEILSKATPTDLVYMDPPYQGVSTGPDSRYIESLDRDRFISELYNLTNRSVPFIISFDGRSGDRIYGEELPNSLGLRRIELAAGQSSQATLNGKTALTVESLYLSPELDFPETSSKINPGRQLPLL